MGMRRHFRDIKQIILRGKRYRIVLATKMGPEDNPIYGQCSDPNDSGKVIMYYVGLKGEKRLEVFIHEMLHACFWDVSEEGIEEGGKCIAKAIWRMGYRLEPDDDLPSATPRFITLRGKRYRFERIAGMKTGTNTVVSAPYVKKKIMQVRSSLKGEKDLQVILMAMLYACYWDFDEEAIKESSKDICRSLWRMGYRKYELV